MESFHADISKWDVSNVIDMHGMFFSAKAFNGDISKWDVSQVVDMNSMLANAESFDGDISKWDVSNVENMQFMFMVAVSFNSDLSKWDVSSVEDMSMMFFCAQSFSHQLDTPAWSNSKATKFRMNFGSAINTTAAPRKRIKTLGTRMYKIVFVTTTQKGRELRAHMLLNTAAISSTMHSQSICPKCGTFTKSGRASCCAPGGAWYDECGGAGNEHVEHTWLEGAKACRRKFEATCMQTCVAQ